MRFQDAAVQHRLNRAAIVHRKKANRSQQARPVDAIPRCCRGGRRHIAWAGGSRGKARRGQFRSEAQRPCCGSSLGVGTRPAAWCEDERPAQPDGVRQHRDDL
jgi:hypothetical protein